MDSSAWTAVANTATPDLVRQIHEDYIEAGASVVTANTFSTARHVLEAVGMGEETVAINRKAVGLALEARERVPVDRAVAVAGSISTMHAWDAEHTGIDRSYLPTLEREFANYREQAETLAEAGADLIMLEMMLDLERASRALEAAVGTGLPVWVGISCSRTPAGELIGWDHATERGEEPGNDRLTDPPPLAEIFDRLVGGGGSAVGIMHTSVATTTPALELLADRWSGPTMAYPETSAASGKTGPEGTSVSPTDFATACSDWVQSGVRIIGGCCGTTVEHIQALTATLEAAG
jgi:S-methylmethionine-dependent homocysteine/selenocysteine methylase